MKRLVWRILSDAWKQISIVISLFTAAFTGWTPMIKQQRAGKIDLASQSRLCIYSHFDKNGRIDAYVVEQLKILHQLNCATVFVSTCSQLTETELEKILPHVSSIVVRRNHTRDFGSWKVGLSLVNDWQRYNQIILMNDSIYGPFFDLKEMFDTMKTRNLNLWGATDSWERAWHIQSYFLVCESSLIKSEFFKQFWHRFRFIDNKEYCINHYEVGISQKALQHGFSLGVYCDYNEVLETALIEETDANTYEFLLYAACRPVNPTHFCWRVLIEKFRFPFLKVELLRHNPSRIPDTGKWRGVLRQHAESKFIEIISDHLKRVMPNKKLTQASWLNKQYIESNISSCDEVKKSIDRNISSQRKEINHSEVAKKRRKNEEKNT